MDKPQCKHCLEYFKEFDNVVDIDEDVYHEGCLEKHPAGYVYFLNEEYLGSDEDYPVIDAYEVFEDTKWDEED